MQAVIASDLMSPEEVTSDTKFADIFEATTCGRCGGSGRMPYSVANGVCFGCGGAGRKLTKRGAEAQRYSRALLTCETRWVQLGDRFYHASPIGGSGWVTVERIGDNAEEKRAGSILDPCSERVATAIAEGATVEPYWLDHETGEARVVVYSGLNIHASGVGHVGASSTAPMRLGDAATRVARMKAVAEYQRALTKAGRPRRGSRYA